MCLTSASTRRIASIAARTDLHLCRLFGLSSGYWLRAQAPYDIEVAERSLTKMLAKIKPWKELGPMAGAWREKQLRRPAKMGRAAA